MGDHIRGVAVDLAPDPQPTPIKKIVVHLEDGIQYEFVPTGFREWDVYRIDDMSHWEKLRGCTSDELAEDLQFVIGFQEEFQTFS